MPTHDSDVFGEVRKQSKKLSPDVASKLGISQSLLQFSGE